MNYIQKQNNMTEEIEILLKEYKNNPKEQLREIVKVFLYELEYNIEKSSNDDTANNLRNCIIDLKYKLTHLEEE